MSSPPLLPPRLDPLQRSGIVPWVLLLSTALLVSVGLAALEVIPIADNPAFESWQRHFDEKGQRERAIWPGEGKDHITIDTQLALLARQNWDVGPSQVLASTPGKRLKAIAEATTDLASGEAILALLILGWLLSQWRGSAAARATLSVGVLGLLLAAADVWILKVLIGRGRPNELIWRGHLDWQPLAIDSNHHSLPSGHSAAAGAVAMMLSLRWPKLSPLWWLLAVALGSTRVLTSSHWPSDVVIGLLIGATAVAVVASLRKMRLAANAAGQEAPSPAHPSTD